MPFSEEMVFFLLVRFYYFTTTTIALITPSQITYIMKKTFGLLFIFTLLNCSNAQKKAFSKEALSEKLLATDGNQVAFETILKNHKGATVVIEIWASWCGDCVQAIPQTKELQTNNPEVDFVFISMDKTANQWKNGIKKHQLVGDHFMANDQMKGVFAKNIDLDWIPRYIIIDKTGKIALYRAVESDLEKINALLQELK